VGSVSPLLIHDESRVRTLRLSFPAINPEYVPGPGGGDDATYHVWFELAALRESILIPNAHVSVLVFDDADRSLARGHTALARAGALPPTPSIRGGSEETAPPRPGLLGDLLLANCRLLRRHLDFVAAASTGSGTASAGASPRIQGSAAAAEAAVGPSQGLLGSEILSVFERIGVDVTEPALRAVEELILVNRKRHAEHWARARVQADEQELRRKRRRQVA
jgi:hypothetical protein